MAAEVFVTTSVCLKRGRSDSRSSSSSSRSRSTSQKEDQKIDGEGDAVMHVNFPASSDEHKFCISAKGRMVRNSVRPVGNLSLMWPRSFRRLKNCCGARAVHEDCGEDGVFTVVLRVHSPGKKWDLSTEAEQKKAWNLCRSCSLHFFTELIKIGAPVRPTWQRPCVLSGTWQVENMCLN